MAIGPLFFLTPASCEDYSALPWKQSFNQMYEQISEERAFTEWKRVDWQSLYV